MYNVFFIAFIAGIRCLPAAALGPRSTADACGR